VCESGIPFLVGGAYAFQRYTEIPRHSRDLDLFARPADAPRIMDLFTGDGYRTELTFPHWLGKIYKGRTTVDVIFSSGNGLCPVDDGWFEHATDDEVLGVRVRLCPVEEMIWSKAFIMERERFDGADVLHLLLAKSPGLDWKRLLQRFGPYGPVLLSHLTAFAFVYPSEGWRIPEWVWSRLLTQLDRDRRHPRGEERLCRGTLLSRSQYLIDAQRGFLDARLPPEGDMSHDDVATWTEAAATEVRSGVPAPLVEEHAQRLREQAPGAESAADEGPGAAAEPTAGDAPPDPPRDDDQRRRAR
jgi:hypothetical protein